MAIRRASYVSLITVTSLLAMLWTFPAVWCFQRDGNIRIKAASPCTESSSHCPGERGDAAGPDCTDVSIDTDGVTRYSERLAGGDERLPHAFAVASVPACSFFFGKAPIVSNLACKDRSKVPGGPDPTTVLII